MNDCHDLSQPEALASVGVSPFQGLFNVASSSGKHTWKLLPIPVLRKFKQK